MLSLIEAAEIDSQFMERKPEGKLYTRQNDEAEYMSMGRYRDDSRSQDLTDIFLRKTRQNPMPL